MKLSICLVAKEIFKQWLIMDRLKLICTLNVHMVLDATAAMFKQMLATDRLDLVCPVNLHMVLEAIAALYVQSTTTS